MGGIIDGSGDLSTLIQHHPLVLLDIQMISIPVMIVLVTVLCVAAACVYAVIAVALVRSDRGGRSLRI